MPSSSGFKFQVSGFCKAVVIVVATCFVYFPALHGGWLWDDDVEITGNLALRSGAGLWRTWFAPPAADYFPLKTTVQWVQWHLWGAHVTGYHATNVGFHLLSAFLLWRLLRKLGVPLGWVGGLIFAIHPLAVESVAWISELKNVLSLPFLLLAMIFWLDWEERRNYEGGSGKEKGEGPPEGGRRAPAAPSVRNSGDVVGVAGARRPTHNRSAYWMALIWFTLAMLCKSSVVMFPFVLLLYAWWKRGRVGWRDLVASAPFFAVSYVLGRVTIWFQFHRALGGESILTGGLPSRIAAAGLAIAFYFWKSVLPVGLMPIYPRWTVDPPSLWQFWPWVAVAIATILIWRWSELPPTRSFGSDEEKTPTTFPMKRIRGNPLHLQSPNANEARSGRHAPPAMVRNLMLGVGFFLINLLPVLGFVPMSFLRLAWVADHLAYLPLVGLVGLAAAAAGKAESGSRKAKTRSLPPWFPLFAFRFSLFLLLAALAIESRHYAGMFANSRMLWTYNLRHNPEAWAARNNLGNALLDAGLVQAATDNYEEALRLHPVYAEVYNNLGNIFSQSGQVAEAAANYQRALQIKPDYAQARNGLGNLLSETGHVPEAIEQFELALRYGPDYADAHNNLANVLFQLGRYREAEDHLKKALVVRPDYPEAHNNLGNVLLRTGRVAGAMAEYREALRLKPDFPQAYNNVGNVEMMSGRFPEAIAAFDESIRLRPGYAEAHYNLGLVLAGTGRGREAIAQFELALQFRPDFPQARAKLEQLEKNN